MCEILGGFFAGYMLKTLRRQDLIVRDSSGFFSKVQRHNQVKRLPLITRKVLDLSTSHKPQHSTQHLLKVGVFKQNLGISTLINVL